MFIKTLGRIVLIAVGVLIMIDAIQFFINFSSSGELAHLFSTSISNILNGENFNDLKPILINFIKNIVILLAAVTAFFCGITGRCGMWFSIFAVFMLTLLVFAIATEVKKDNGFNGPAIATICLDSISIIGYIVGFILLRIGNNK